MNELLISVLLLLPSPDKAVGWDINKVPTQLQILHKDGLQVSYQAAKVPCSVAVVAPQKLYSSSPEDCYLILDTTEPVYIRHPYKWFPVKGTRPNDK
jgi:hypothetical protein|tara:strand:+ start:50 stop:340 length:291 start_codon:yes stop_codon:yes gene_type:complete